MTEGLKDSPVPWIRIRDLDPGSDPESRSAIRKTLICKTFWLCKKLKTLIIFVTNHLLLQNN
jgi:hypothetical protein